MWLTAHLHELVICWLNRFRHSPAPLCRWLVFTERLRLNAKVVMDKEWRARFGVIVAKMNISKAIEFRETAKVLHPW